MRGRGATDAINQPLAFGSWPLALLPLILVRGFCLH
jgi:hypothetical protein